MKTVCAVEVCDDMVIAKDLCGKHYQRQSKGVDPHAKIECPGCGKRFEKTGRQKFCGRRCRSRLWMRDRLGIEDPGRTRQCWWCQGSFDSTDGRQDYCKPECSRIGSLLYNIQRMYGVSREEYRAAYFAQDGLCLVCKRPERTARNTLLAVDHDHETNTFRGLLCSHCNRAVGLFGDDPDVMRAAADYVEKHRANHLKGMPRGGKEACRAR